MGRKRLADTKNVSLTRPKWASQRRRRREFTKSDVKNYYKIKGRAISHSKEKVVLSVKTSSLTHSIGPIRK